MNREELFESWDNWKNSKAEIIAKREAEIKAIYDKYTPVLNKIDNTIDEILKEIDKL